MFPLMAWVKYPWPEKSKICVPLAVASVVTLMAAFLAVMISLTVAVDEVSV